ncbi:hypothetical protein HK103_007477 [Boothiomyces macroporosus]|uniref:Uncharacterized protein n=1 Tax=Boothiomyces macroporosus TaxID=261099 RepID=A0AAD5UGD1_9FUNG|nr:hypothetical protein HK103_007477 [Boothiomyces macroporosus]
MMKTLISLPLALAYHYGTIDIFGDLTVVPYPDSLGKEPLVNWGIDYNVTLNRISYYADSDGGCTFDLQDGNGNFCVLVLNCHPEDETCELMNHQIYPPTEELVHKGVWCVPDRMDVNIDDGRLVTEKLFVSVYPSE